MRLTGPPGARRSLRLAVSAIGIAVLALAALGASARLRAPPPHRLVVAAVRQPATSLFFVAKASGCFADAGLEVEERTFELGRDALVDLLGGKADVAVAYETPILRSYGRDARLRVLTMLHSSTANTRAVARRDRGVASAADLRGKRLGAARGTNADFFVDHLLALGGVAREEVTVVDVAPEDAARAIAAGEVDAVALSDPYAAHARDALRDGAVEIVTDLYVEFSMAATLADTLAARRPALLALVRGLACGERFLLEHRAAAEAAVLARFPEQSEAETRAALARVTRAVGLDETLRAVLRREARWMARGGAALPDVERLIDPTLLAEVEPEAMNLVAER